MSEPMNHPSADELVLHYYGEANGELKGPVIDAHMAACGECRASFESLRTVLSAVVAEDALGATFRRSPGLA